MDLEPLQLSHQLNQHPTAAGRRVTEMYPDTAGRGVAYRRIVSHGVLISAPAPAEAFHFRLIVAARL